MEEGRLRSDGGEGAGVGSPERRSLDEWWSGASHGSQDLALGRYSLRHQMGLKLGQIQFNQPWKPYLLFPARFIKAL